MYSPCTLSEYATDTSVDYNGSSGVLG